MARFVAQTVYLVADGVIAALGFKTAATLLKTIELQTWDAILSFAAIFALRVLVKRFLFGRRAGYGPSPPEGNRQTSSLPSMKRSLAATGVVIVILGHIAMSSG